MSEFADEENEKLERYRGEIVKYMSILDEGHENIIQIGFMSGRTVTIKYDYLYGVEFWTPLNKDIKP